jgi:CheY-like chemotaxis protein
VPKPQGSRTKIGYAPGNKQINPVSGVLHVGTEWRQVQMSSGAQTEDRSTAANPRTTEAGGGGTQIGGTVSPSQATVGVGMNTPLLALPLSATIPGAAKKKRVLLIDTSHAKRDLRAEALRTLGMDVDCAADIGEARSWWRPTLFDLVLINTEKGQGQRDSFYDDLRSATPPQRLVFLVGQPEYLSDSPSTDQELAMESGTSGPPSVVRKASFLPIRAIRFGPGAFWKLRGESSQPAPRPSLAATPCAPFLLLREILKDDHRNSCDTDQPG